MPAAFETALHTFEHTYGELLQIAASYPLALQTQAGVCGNWSAREVLAHLAGWLAEARRRFPRYATGTGDIHYNVDIFNRASVRMRRDHSYEQILIEIRASSAELRDMAHKLTPAQVAHDTRYAEWLDTLAQDAAAHMQQLVGFVKEVNP